MHFAETPPPQLERLRFSASNHGGSRWSEALNPSRSSCGGRRFSKVHVAKTFSLRPQNGRRNAPSRAVGAFSDGAALSGRHVRRTSVRPLRCTKLLDSTIWTQRPEAPPGPLTRSDPCKLAFVRRA
eukprot:6813540-Prymnesium_polylepis.3